MRDLRVIVDSSEKNQAMTDVESSVSSDPKPKSSKGRKAGGKEKPKVPRASKRGANEDSEVRYDTKHALKKQKATKGADSEKVTKRQKKAKVVSDAEDGEEGVEGDENTIVSGNEDDRGSVVSAILDEDICYTCGLCTLDDPDNWNNVVMCDTCDGEYHLKCQGLECTPEGAFFCTRCKRDEEFYRDFRYEVSESFKVHTNDSSFKCTAVVLETLHHIILFLLHNCAQIPPRPNEERSIVYSPAKPLPLAWEECKQKGLMVVSDVFSLELMR